MPPSLFSYYLENFGSVLHCRIHVALGEVNRRKLAQGICIN